MKTRGFTLVELLAIIILLAIIAVITIPKINEQVEKSKKQLAQTSALNYKKAVDEYYYQQMMNKNNITLNGEYNINTNGYLYNEDNTYEIQFDGEKPTNGTLTYLNNELNSACITINNYQIIFSNGEISNVEKGTCNFTKISTKEEIISAKANTYVKAALTANSTLTNETVKTISEMSDVTTNVADTGWIHFGYDETNGVTIIDYSLTYGNYTANYSSYTNEDYISTFGESRTKPIIVGSEKCFGEAGSQECFTIIKKYTENDTEKAMLFAKYNLKKDTTNNTYKQDSSSQDAIAFSSSAYWHDSTNDVLKSEYAKDINGNAASYSGNPYPYVYDSNSNTYAYVEGYLTTLKTATYGLPSSATGRLLTIEEAENATMFANDTARSNGYNYWLSSAVNNEYLYSVNKKGSFNTTIYNNTVNNIRVRPVIIINTSDM